MSELSGPAFEPDDMFEMLTAEFGDDKNYAKDIADINDQMDQLDVASLFEQRFGTIGPKGAYYTVPIVHELQQIVDSFKEYCEQIDVDPYAANISPDSVEQLVQHVGLKVYELKKSLAPGDTISATVALLIDVEDDFSAEFVGESQRVQGEFIGVTVGTIPDDITILTMGESGETPLGVGLILEKPVIIENDGTREALALDDHRIIMALGTIGLKVDKHFYQSEHRFITPPDITLTD